MDSTDFLILLLSIGMSLVLLFTIVALYYAVKILRSIQSITERAEKIADDVEQIGSFFKKSAGPAAVAKMVANMFENYREGKGDK